MRRKTGQRTLSLIRTNRKVMVAAVILIILGALWVAYNATFGPPDYRAEPEQFTVTTGMDDSNEVATALLKQGFIKSEAGFRIALMDPEELQAVCVDCIMPGAYKISKTMNVWELVSVMKKGPYMKWIPIQEGLRKEQIAEILAQTLHWDQKTQYEWVMEHTAAQDEYREGVYFPDTYLIPVDEEPAKVAERFRAKFNEKFAPYAQETQNQNIKWTTLINIASLVQREAANKNDMPIVAGIIWNRLLEGMRLQLDATVQYARDTKLFESTAKPPSQLGNLLQIFQTNAQSSNSPQALVEWWKPITPEDKEIDSPYNTYIHEGLPPSPIANPGLDAIEAALYPEETDCIYYIHDRSGTIHCAETYDKHRANISEYLR